MRRRVVGVMGPGERASRREKQMAYRLGRLVAAEGWVLLTGGRDKGVMDAASRGSSEAGGLVVGVLPSAEPRGLSAWVDIAILTGMGNARNSINVLTSDVVIACGAETAGTLSEIALALKSGKRVIVLGAGSLGRKYLKKIGGSKISFVTNPQEAIHRVKGSGRETAK